jgi:uncharacterized protein (DUF58 family)
MSVSADRLRSRAEHLAQPLPPLMAAAQQLAATVVMGVHGRRRPGPGEDFWQYRQAMPGDALAQVDWRRSARSDALFIREKEWEAAQSVGLWCDVSASMDYSGGSSGSRPGPTTKADRARLLVLALASLLLRGDERVGLLASPEARPRAGRGQTRRLALALAGDLPATDVGLPPPPASLALGHYVLVSDFLAPEAELLPRLDALMATGAQGVLLQVLDESEVEFPFDGRVRFVSMGGTLTHETRRARALQDSYRQRLQARTALLQERARRAGWHFARHLTSAPPRVALVWLHQGLGRGAGA